MSLLAPIREAIICDPEKAAECVAEQLRWNPLRQRRLAEALGILPQAMEIEQAMARFQQLRNTGMIPDIVLAPAARALLEQAETAGLGNRLPSALRDLAHSGERS